KIKLIADLPELQAHRKYSFILQAHNAALRGECRINQASAYHFHHQNSLQTKNATRHESRLNALLCLRLKGLSFTIPRA
ncbi:hypothetical protein QX226_22650, partial [Vibrio vulnificus]|uniref:hypothetical protein n=1 Tax=Vibrio vulnificus TaxID=672 RepID=UPI002879F9EC|nr:hypothetical protein [Vibrio vulnificus]MDS1855304.1 hypothetical protein [Vibrio vulnificus]